MPAIFIWKSTTPYSPNIKTISCYTGSNWFLEDYGTHSKSAMYMDQHILSDGGIMYDIQWMPHNWVGSHVLENVHVPYSVIRDVEWGTLERIGNWMRFTTTHDISTDERDIIWKKIKELEEEPCLINISMGVMPRMVNKISPKRFQQKGVSSFTAVQTHV